MPYRLSLLIVLVLFISGCSKDDQFFNQNETAKDLCNSLERYSVSIYRPSINYPLVKNNYLNSITSNLTELEFYEQTKTFLLVFKDPHIWLQTPFENMYSIEYLNYTKNINFSTIKNNYLHNIVSHSDNIISATINDSIGYIFIRNFNGVNSEIEPIFNAIIDGFSGKSGLIIDVRDNDGGSVYNAQSLLNKLVSDRTLWLTTENRTKDGFDDKYEWYINPKGNFQFTNNVVVLTGRYTISAGERFAIGAKLLPHVKVIGDTTANTQGSIMGREMLSGWKYTFTFERCLSFDGTSYEGIGIPPDIYYNSESLDLTNNDEIIERAISELQ